MRTTLILMSKSYWHADVGISAVYAYLTRRIWQNEGKMVMASSELSTFSGTNQATHIVKHQSIVII